MIDADVTQMNTILVTASPERPKVRKTAACKPRFAAVSAMGFLLLARLPRAVRLHGRLHLHRPTDLEAHALPTMGSDSVRNLQRRHPSGAG